MSRASTSVAAAALVLLTACSGQDGGTNKADQGDSDYAGFVNPFVGTDGTGHTFPGATYPFGMIQVSPDTNNHSWDHTSGYQYQDQSIMGFSQNHLSGTGISDFGDVLLQPYADDLARESYRSGFDRATETASPGYYSVQLTDHRVGVELTSSEHVALHRYDFKDADASNVYVDFQHGIVNAWIPLNEHVLTSDIQINDGQTISGYLETESWVRHQTHFVIKFSKPMVTVNELERRPGEQAPRYVLGFGSLGQEPLLVKIALSTVSAKGANANLAVEVPHWDFDRVRNEARVAWNTYLARIEIEAPQKQKEIFYTALYHLLIQPNNTADVDGRYRAHDETIQTTPDRGHYSTLSIWDTYRAAHPLYTILVPEMADDFVNSMIRQHEKQGFLPIWGLMNKETYTMIGNHAVPIVVDAVLKEIPGVDAERAYAAVHKSLTVSHKNSDWELYEQYGYYPFDKLDSDGESVSRTLVSSYDDFAAAQLAKHLGKQGDYQRFFKRSEYYRNLFDASTGFMRGKDSNGAWRADFDPLEATSPMNNPGDYTEANANQYSWAAQHAAAGMIDLFGSKEAFAAKLDEFFTTQSPGAEVHLGQEAMIGQYVHGNEPSHHIAYLYQYADQPEKTERLVSRIYQDFYDNTPDGIQGNEDCGQMSAWYIFTTLGFYPVDPSSGEYVLGRPQVEKAVVHFSNGTTFTIRNAPATDQDADEAGVFLNQERLDGISIRHRDLTGGGELIFR